MINNMFKKPVPLKLGDKTKFAPVQNFKFAKGVGAVAINYLESNEVAKHYPIFFVKDVDGYSPIALLGLDRNRNLFVNSGGEWKNGRYIPALIRLYPFAFVKQADSKEGEISIAYDGEYEGINSPDGEPFFKENGELSPFGEKVKDFAEETFKALRRTQEMLKLADSLGLLSPVDITIGKEGEKQYKVTGVFQVEGEKLNSLSDEHLLEVTKSGLLHLIYNHLDSASNFGNLIS